MKLNIGQKNCLSDSFEMSSHGIFDEVEKWKNAIIGSKENSKLAEYCTETEGER